MEQKTVRVLTRKPGEPTWTQTEIKDDIDDMQALVDGRIECIELTPTIDLWVNEEYLLREDFEVNLLLASPKNIHRGNIISGPVFLAGIDDEGSMTSLSDSQIEWIQERTTFNPLRPNNFRLDLTKGVL